MHHKPCLYVLATPLGNLGDISPRAQTVLQEADWILCEDTRSTKKLLSCLGISSHKPMESYFDGIEGEKAPLIIEKILSQSLTVVLVSDAGTPCIADPGYRLLAEAHRAGLRVLPIPGPSSAIALASVSGLPTNKILFLGFLPRKESELRREFESWKTIPASVVFFETSQRLAKTLPIFWDVHPGDGVRLAIGRELTKKFEEVIQGSRQEIQAWLDKKTELKGELVLMAHIPPVQKDKNLSSVEVRIRIRELLKDGRLRQKEIIEALGTHHGLSQKEIYSMILEEKNKNLP
jgi:16S rRNA (cytidine1402-2'-O)-methyltransferase